jgi:predicted small secreted protein
MHPVTKDGTRPLVALVFVVLAAALLAACGGSGSDASSTASSLTTTDVSAGAGSQEGSSQSAPQKSGSQGQSNGQEQNGGQSKQVQAQQASGGSRARKSVETPLKVSGGGSGQFRTKGGDNSIQEFGDESDESELQEAAEVVHGFYVSRAAEEWDKACSYLAKPNVEQLEKLANQSAQSEGADCATVLKAFTQPLPAAVEREITTVDAGSLRHEGEQGFLIYFGPGHVKYAMPLRDEGGSWKVAALSGTTLS